MAKITVETADTSAALAHGLMHRKSLDKDTGMLFNFPNLIEARFWGINTYIPLDIAFIHNGKITDINHISPMSTRMIHSKGLCSSAIEVNAGFFKENNIQPGHHVLITDNVVEFKEC